MLDDTEATSYGDEILRPFLHVGQRGSRLFLYNGHFTVLETSALQYWLSIKTLAARRVSKI